MIGATLARYRVTAKLGEGGMGSVWLAEDTLLGRAVALKLLAPHLAASDVARQRFIREARAASRLEHAGIAAVYDAGEAEGHVFIAYQLIEGVTLARRLENGPLPLPDLLRLARGTAEALAHAHGRDVLHRDLTAGNIMLRADGSPVIVDFGLARTHGDVTLTRTGATFGTAPYLAPEQWRGEPGDARTDLWSLGVALYYAATGQQPFGADAPEAVMYRVLNDEPAKPTKLRPELPAEFEPLLLRLLEKDAQDRLASAAELASALQAIASGEVQAAAESVSGETTVARVGRWWRRQARKKFGPLQVASVALIVLATVAVALFVQRQLAQRQQRVLAVLPMQIAAGDSSEAAVVADALGEELIARFRDATRLRVLPWVTTGRPGMAERPLGELAHEIHAEYLLTGSIRTDDNGSQVRAELVEGRRGTTIWARDFTTTPGTFPELQRQIVLAVSERLSGAMSHDARDLLQRETARDPEAYEYFIRGSNAWHSGDPERQEMARQFLEQAVLRDSTLAPAWVALGATHLQAVHQGLEADTALAVARRCFELALRLRPDLPVAERGLIRLGNESGGNGQIGRMLEIAARALQRDPQNVDQLTTAAWGFTLGCQADLAIPVIEHAIKLDPGNQGLASYRVLACAWGGQPARAIAAGADYIRRFGEAPGIYTHMGGCSINLRRYSDAVTYLSRAVSLNGTASFSYGKNMLVHAHRLNRDSAAHAVESRRVINELQVRLAANPLNMRLLLGIAQAYAEAGEPDQVVAVLQRIAASTADPARVEWWTNVGHKPEFAFLLAEAMARAGSLGEARRTIAAISPDDEDAWSAGRDTVGLPELDVEPEIAELRSTPEYRALVDSQEARLQALFDRYQPIVAAALPNEPDVPRPRKNWPRNPVP